MLIGIADLKNVIRMPGTWDLTYLRQWQTKNGVTFDQIVQQIGAALVTFNSDLTQSYIGQFVMSTIENTAEYDIGGETGDLPKVSEYGKPDPVHGQSTGHMLPLADYGGALGWTYMAMRRMQSGKIDRDVRRLIERSWNTWERAIMRRMFKSTYDLVGSTGRSVPWCDAGVADATYIPPTVNGKTFDATHSHFLIPADKDAAAAAMSTHLLEHGYVPPFDLLVSDADKAIWAAATGFRKPYREFLPANAVDLNIPGIGGQPRAVVDENLYMGILETDDGWFNIKPSPRIPTGYCGAFPLAGFDSPDAPLAVRYEDGYPLGLALVGEIRDFPLQEAVAYLTFGVGVNDRTAGVVAQIGGIGAYADPTIS
jgi:hypothetical protein